MQAMGCSDAVTALKVTLQNLTNAGNDAYVLYVDIVKAFDSVNRELLWKILEKYGIPECLTATIKKMYDHILITARVGEAKTQFESTSGVKQGDNLAPVLFLFVVQAVMDTMEKNWPVKQPELFRCPSQFDPKERKLKRKGSLTRRMTKDLIPLHHSKSLYADDGAFIFLSKEDLIEGTKFIRDSFSSFGLKVHLGTRATGQGNKDEKSKTEAMYFPRHSKRKDTTPQELLTGSFDVGDGRFVSFSCKFKYLGSFITPDLDDTFDVESRITSATGAFKKLHSILSDKTIDLSTRRALYLAMPINILLSGCESWALSAKHFDKLEKFHNKCVRKMRKISMWHVQKYRIKNAESLRRVKMQPMKKIIRVRQLRFLQKVSNKPQRSLTVQIMSSQAARVEGEPFPRGRMLSTRRSYVDALADAGLIKSGAEGNGGELEEWMPKLCKRTAAETIEKNIGLPEGFFHKGRKKRKTDRTNAKQSHRVPKLMPYSDPSLDRFTT